MNFEEIFDQLDACNYECEAGKLQNNQAYIELKKAILNMNKKSTIIENFIPEFERTKFQDFYHKDQPLFVE